MRVHDLDITENISDALSADTFLFNPSIAPITGDTYLLAVRSFIGDIGESKSKEQHPWKREWDGEEDHTYILPTVIVDSHVQPITQSGWPIRIPVQDMRIFHFMKDGNKAVYILTYNQSYDEAPNMIIKGGDDCGSWCYIINWAYLLVDINTLEYTYCPANQPLCMNVSNPVEKNWSMWRLDYESKIHLMVSYALTPIHTVFSLCLEGINDGEIVANSVCRMKSPRPGKEDNILGELENHYDKELFVSLSTPSYPLEEGFYQAVGHIKVKRDYLKTLVKNKDNSKLAKFAEKHIPSGKNVRLHEKFIYFMFLYRFRVLDAGETDELDITSGVSQLTGSAQRIEAVITHVSPAFVCKVDKYDYLLNFPAGMALREDKTIISYGNGDSTAHLMYFDNNDLGEFIKPVTELTPANFKFIYAAKNKDGVLNL